MRVIDNQIWFSFSDIGNYLCRNRIIKTKDYTTAVENAYWKCYQDLIEGVDIRAIDSGLLCHNGGKRRKNKYISVSGIEKILHCLTIIKTTPYPMKVNFSEEKAREITSNFINDSINVKK